MNNPYHFSCNGVHWGAVFWFPHWLLVAACQGWKPLHGVKKPHFPEAWSGLLAETPACQDLIPAHHRRESGTTHPDGYTSSPEHTGTIMTGASFLDIYSTWWEIKKELLPTICWAAIDVWKQNWQSLLIELDILFTCRIMVNYNYHMHFFFNRQQSSTNSYSLCLNIAVSPFFTSLLKLLPSFVLILD